MPRTIEPNKVTITPQYYTRANQRAPKSLKTEQNPKSQNTYPVTTFKRKSFKIHVTPNSSPITSSEEARNTSPSDISNSTKASRRKKTRKRMKNKSLTKQEASKLLENVDNYPKTEESINNEGRNKSKKLGLQIKYNVEPRPFSSEIRSGEKNQENNLEKLIDGEVNSNNTNISDRNVHPKNVKISDGYSKDYSKIMGPLKISSSGSKRKLYEDTEDSSTVKSNPLSTSTNESFKPNKDNPSYKNIQTTERNDFESESSTNKPIYNNRKYISESDIDPSFKVSSVTQSNLYKNIPATIDSMNPIVSTPVSFTESNLYSSSHMHYYPPLLPTMVPLQQFKSTVENESKVDNSNENKENTKEDNEEINKASSDDVTVVTTSENDENEKRRKYEIRQNEDHQTEDQQNHRDLPETAEDSSERYKKYEDKGYRRYAHKYNDKEEEEEEDVVSDGTHDNESHQSAKEGAADDASGKGGEKKFEKGGATEEEEEHHKSEGEKEEKVGDVNTIGSTNIQYLCFDRSIF